MSNKVLYHVHGGTWGNSKTTLCGRPKNEWDTVGIKDVTVYDTNPKTYTICKNCMEHPDVQLHLLTLVG